MNDLRNRYRDAGITDIDFAIINYGDPLSKLYIHYLEQQVDFPILQEQTAGEVWNALEGGKDDMLIFDRCGHLTFHVRLPYANLLNPYVEHVLNATYFETVTCTNCPKTKEHAQAEPEPELEEEVVGTTEVIVTEFATETENTTAVTDDPEETAEDILDNPKIVSSVSVERNSHLVDKHSQHVDSKQNK